MDTAGPGVSLKQVTKDRRHARGDNVVIRREIEGEQLKTNFATMQRNLTEVKKIAAFRAPGVHRDPAPAVTIPEKHLCERSGAMSSYVLTDLQGRPVLEVMTKQELRRLWQHLHNGNGPFDYVMGFRETATGERHYARAKKIPVDRGISWAVATVQGRKAPDKSLAFVPYSTNADQMSRWGGFDFDAHDGNVERARRLAFNAFRHLLNCESAVILETSGSGGWHVWAIALQFKPVPYWIRLLKGIAQDIGAIVQDGICEIFPPDTLSRGFGKGLRAPGAWNPDTNRLSEIYWQNADALIVELPQLLSGKWRIGEVASYYSGTSSIEKEISLSLLPFPVLAKLIGGAEPFRITQAATRRAKLKETVGASFHQVSRSVAEHIARAQFAERTVVTNADEVEHLKDFTGLWSGLEKRWLDSLSQNEQERFAQLTTDAERAAFRIIASYARKAEGEGALDFPIAVENLGNRLGITREGAGQLRKKFVRSGIIVETVPFRANVAAARFRWLLGNDATNEPF